MSFPNKEQRQKCWDSRDRYWECLDRNADDASRCTETRSFYESRCPSQWVKHFDRKREYLKFKDKIENDGLKYHSAAGQSACTWNIVSQCTILVL
ncbi:cytochrome c oxidase assembly factor 6 homolog isoform X2 [Amblyomma americanum]